MKTLTVAAATERDLETLEKVCAGISQTALAASAMVLARELDASANSATSKSMCARSLLETMDRLQEMAPAGSAGDRLDELERARARRRGAA